MSSNKMKTLTINGVQFTIVDETVGSLGDLNTTDKSSVVAAVNEVVSNAGSGSGGGSVTIDATLTQEGQAADAKAVGDKLNKLKDEISELNDVYVGTDEPTDPNVQIWVNPDEDIPDVNYVKSVNGKTPDENGNVEIPVPDDSVDLTGYATEQFVQDGFQPKGDYLPSAELPNAVNDALVQAKESGKFDGEKGEPGNSGVYIGSTKPVDPDINVWINPDEDLDDDTYVKSVNGITPDENGNVEIKIPESSGSSVTIDPTLTQSGQAADAKAVGDALAELEKKIPSIEGLATEEYVDTAIANIDFPTGGSTKVMPLPLLADVTSAEALSDFEVTLSKRAIRRVLMQITIPASEAPGGAFYGRLNGKLWDAMIFGNAELPANGAKWLELEFMEGSLAKFMVSASSGGMWARSTANTCGALQPYNYVDSIGVALMSGKTTPAGTRIQVWGE